MNRDELRKVVSNILELDNSEVVDDSLLVDLGWDSLADLAFIAEVDAKSGIKVESGDLGNAKTVADLATLIGVVD